LMTRGTKTFDKDKLLKENPHTELLAHGRSYDPSYGYGTTGSNRVYPYSAAASMTARKFKNNIIQMSMEVSAKRQKMEM